MEQPLKATFHNIDTRTREERYAARDRDLFEKSMLKARREQFYSYRDPGGITSPEPGAPTYAPPEDRFQRDFAAEMRKSKELKLQKMEETFDKKREEQQQKEQERWDKMAAEYESEQQRLEALRQAGLGGARNNASSEHFNIISLTYHDTREGHKLQHSDEITRYRAVLRSQHLADKAHSVPHNIITGQPRINPVKVPPPPVKPSDI